MSLEDVNKRVTTLETEVGAIRQEAAATRVLAASADRDVADFREELGGDTRVLGALRETQVEQGQAITQQGQAITRLSAAVDQIRDEHGARLNDIVGLLNHLIDRDQD